MEFKPYTKDELDACLELFDLNCPRFFAREERADYLHFLQLLSDAGSAHTVYLLGWREQRLIACFGMAPVSPETCALTWIMVHPEYQRQGCGEEMMAQLFTRAAAARYRKVAVSTSQHAVQFFARFGAVTLRSQNDGWGPGMHRVDMEISLPSVHTLTDHTNPVSRFSAQGSDITLYLKRY